MLIQQENAAIDSELAERAESQASARRRIEL
jgi:hypothetical protein